MHGIHFFKATQNQIVMWNKFLQWSGSKAVSLGKWSQDAWVIRGKILWVCWERYKRYDDVIKVWIHNHPFHLKLQSYLLYRDVLLFWLCMQLYTASLLSSLAEIVHTACRVRRNWSAREEAPSKRHNTSYKGDKFLTIVFSNWHTYSKKLVNHISKQKSNLPSSMPKMLLQEVSRDLCHQVRLQCRFVR